MRVIIGRPARRVLPVAGASLAFLLAPGTALASGHGQTSNPEANLPFLFGVYTVTWIAFFAYAFYMTRRQRDLRREIEDLRRELEENQSRTR